MLKIYCNLLFKSFSKYIFRGFLCTAVLSLPMADLEAKNEIKTRWPICKQHSNRARYLVWY